MDTLKTQTREQEMQQKNVDLQNMFNKNMAFFKNADPSIYEKYINYIPEKIRLIYTEDGHINLANTEHENKLVYSGDPKQSAKEKVNEYCKKPFSEFFYAEPSVILDLEEDIHTSSSNRLIEYLNGLENISKDSPLENQTEFMIVLGVGLGYHIEELLNRTKIRHLNIVETHEDVFFASLNTLDWAKIASHYEGEDTSLHIIVGQTPEKFSAMMFNHLENIGMFSAAKPFIFKHLISEKMQLTSKEFFRSLSNFMASAGYYDDERIGLSHTVDYLNKNVPILKGHSFLSQVFNDTPVLLVANGPSLDMAVEFLKKNQSKCVIVTCGSALSSMYKMGVKPDFHIEQERTRPPVELIETATDVEFRKGITLLALNTTHPDLLTLFDQLGLGLKMNDLGSIFFGKHAKQNEVFIQLGSCNPTVANAGFAFCTALGFTNVYLVGIDLGFVNDLHHSSMSFHYRVQKDKESVLRTNTKESSGNIEADGNFGGKVVTSDLYVRTKEAIEYLLSDFKKFTPVHCYNTSNGIKINGAEPTPFDDIDTSAWKVLNKKDLTKKIFNDGFTKNYSCKNIDSEAVVKIFNPALNIIDESYKILKQRQNTHEEMTQALIKINNLLIGKKDKEDELSYMLLKGSFTIFPLLLAQCFYMNTQKETAVDIFNTAKQHFLSFLERAKKDIHSEFLRHDTRKLGLAEIFKK